MSQNIELAKPRDFGEIINDTFAFIKQNLKPLLKYFFIFCGFFIAAAVISSSFYQIKMTNTVNNISSGSYNNMEYKPSFFNFFGTELLLMGIFTVLSVITIQVTVLSYIALYKAKNNQVPTTEEMWGYIKFYYLKILGCYILINLLLGIGVVLCILPGIYFAPILALILPIMVIENTSFGYAFSRCFILIKDNWWVTFGTMAVVWIIFSVCRGIIILPTTIINAVSLITHPRKAALSVPVAVITSILQQLCQVFLIIPVTTLALCYFNLTESKDGTSLMDKINKLGTTNPDTDLPAEEY
jgi:hypothetical protein